MKNILLLIAMIITGYKVHAQEFNTNEKISDQLKKGSVQGLQFAPVKASRKAPGSSVTENHSETIRTQLKNGSVQGMSFKTGGTAARSAVKPATTNRTSPLASETDVPKVTSIKPAAVTLPTQKPAPTKQ